MQVELTREEVEHLKHLLREVPDWCIKDKIYGKECKHYKSIKEKLNEMV